jgi:predicted transcriptional regulator
METKTKEYQVAKEGDERWEEDEERNSGPGKAPKKITDPKAVDFLVAMALAKYGFGAMYTAKQLYRSRGLIQSWKKLGKKHHLAKRGVSKEAVKKRLWKIRRITTFKNLDYHLAQRFFEYDISSAYIARVLNIPTSTVNSWRHGNIPLTVRNEFVDEELVDAKFQSVLNTVRRELTEEYIDYLLARKIAEEGEKHGVSIGGRTISKLISTFLNKETLPERTVSSWIKGERKPHNISEELVDHEFLEETFKELVKVITKQDLNYHLSMALYNEKGWKYSAIALFLGLDKEKVRGWTKKNRGSSVAKLFKDKAYVDKVLDTLLKSDMTPDGICTCLDRLDNCK